MCMSHCLYRLLVLSAISSLSTVFILFLLDTPFRLHMRDREGDSILHVAVNTILRAGKPR